MATQADDDDQADDVAAMAERLGIKPEVLQRCTELAEFTEAEIAAVVSQLTAENEEATTDVILARLKRSRHKEAAKPRRGRRGKGK